ncbi:hypothetical protein [Pseudaestuariivita atlantica]|uniref:Pyrroline-5-carboxylate reductase catalytic N-terminal domain-containing protein n=1 Tax=Pseudaestuariivita atlantica TaxID=1317121 RepID=A0A0L1JUP3_9RHOB|nr:hypothetical protein [Pseudaestuariivita atlantica]KNG95476.1 hypothetical protein ATO11_02435 [Pseudaestuariivita atlantica]
MEQKTALIVGAGHTAAERMAVQLAELNWQVIVVGQDAERLMALAERAPDRIDPLPMALNSRENAEQLGAVWGDEPLHALAQFQPVLMPLQITLAVRSVALMTGAFAAGLRAARGVNLVAMPRSRDLEDPLSQAAEGAHSRALRALALAHQKAGFRTVGLLSAGARGKAIAGMAVDIATGALPTGNGAVRAV